MKRALYIVTVGSFLNFERNDIKILQSLGYEVHCAANFSATELDDFQADGIIRHQIDFARLPFSRSNIKAIRQLKELFKKINFYLVHCHTPVGGIIGRMVARKERRHGEKVYYTAHGFHFYKGAPLKNWLLFYPAEWICSWWTDVQITINTEDYRFATKHLHAKKTVYVPGVGINTEKFRCGLVDRNKKRAELGLKASDVMILSVGELSRRKNHVAVIQAIEKLQCSSIQYFICGEGKLRDELHQKADGLGVGRQIHFLGFRKDISELCQAADLYILPSRQEGLPVALMEAIACQTPVLCSRIRGNVDLVEDESCMFQPDDVNSLVHCLKSKLGDVSAQKIRETLRKNMEAAVSSNYKNLREYNLISVADKMKRVYMGETVRKLTTQ